MTIFNHKSIAVLALSVICLGACEDYLNEEVTTAINIEAAYENPETYQQLIGTVYERAREYTTRYTSDIYYSLEDLGTDIVTRGGSVIGSDEINDYVNVNATNYVYEVYWGNQYSIIAAANLVIESTDQIQGLSDADKEIGMGEVKFFRAWSYFNLVENFGGVPLVVDEITTAQTEFTKASEEEVYHLIVNDLRAALDGVPTTPSVHGRVSKGAVRHLLSKVLLTRGYKSFAESTDYSEAASLAEAVIAAYPLEESYEELVAIDNQRNAEVVFAYMFGSNSSSRGWGNSKHMMYKFRFYDYPGLSRSVQGLGPVPTPFFFSLFEEEDERADASYQRVIYADEEAKVLVGADSVDIAVGDTAMYFPEIAWDQAQIERKPYVVINPDRYFENDGTTVVHYPLFQKFDDPGVPFTQPDQSSQGERDMVMMRSGEAYLIAAEAYLQSSNAASAATHLTTLRSRAGISAAVTSSEVDIDFILDERARELMGEVSRWMDLKRTSKLIERTLAHNPHAALNNALNTDHYLRPIPQREIDSSQGSIVQNEAYQ